MIYIGQRLAIPGRSADGSAPSATTYTVKFGDTLSAIAQAFGISLEALMQANNLTEPSLIRVGQVLRIPGQGQTSTPASTVRYTVQYGDTLNLIAQRFGVSIYAIAQANNLADINLLRVGQVLVIPGAQGGGTSAPQPRRRLRPPPMPRTYTVQPGDTLNAIAARFEVYVNDLAAYNGLSLTSIIRPRSSVAHTAPA